MELSFWDNTFPHIKKQPIDRLLYGKHAYRVEVVIAGAKCLQRSNKGRSDDEFKKQFAALQSRIFMNQTYPALFNAKWKGAKINHSLLKKIYLFLQKYDEQLKTRIGDWVVKKPGRAEMKATGDKFFVSSNDPALLEEFALFFKFIPNQMISITFPANENDHTAINSGAILKKNEPVFKFQIALSNKVPHHSGHNGRKENHKNVLAHLDNLATDVFVPASTRHRLESSFWLGGAMIYTNDPTLLGFISLIDPYILGKISPLVRASDK